MYFKTVILFHSEDKKHIHCRILPNVAYGVIETKQYTVYGYGRNLKHIISVSVKQTKTRMAAYCYTGANHIGSSKEYG